MINQYTISIACFILLHNAYLLGYYCAEKDRKKQRVAVWEMVVLLMLATAIDVSMSIYKYFKRN